MSLAQTPAQALQNHGISGLRRAPGAIVRLCKIVDPNTQISDRHNGKIVAREIQIEICADMGEALHDIARKSTKDLVTKIWDKLPATAQVYWSTGDQKRIKLAHRDLSELEGNLWAGFEKWKKNQNGRKEIASISPKERELWKQIQRLCAATKENPVQAYLDSRQFICGQELREQFSREALKARQEMDQKLNQRIEEELRIHASVFADIRKQAIIKKVMMQGQDLGLVV